MTGRHKSASRRRDAEDLLALDEALRRPAAKDARAGRVAERRFFTGLDERETAEALGLSIAGA